MHSWKEDCLVYLSYAGTVRHFVFFYMCTYIIYIVKTSVFLSCDRKYYLLVSMLKRPRDS